jgi:hypothetical protein
MREYFGDLRHAFGFALQVRKLIRRKRTQTLELGHRTEAARSARFFHAVLVVPLAPEKRVEIVRAEAAHGGRHLALKRLPPHLPVGDDLQPEALLQRDRVIDGAVFDRFEFRGGDCPDAELFLRRAQFRRAKQTANDVGPCFDHVLLWLTAVRAPGRRDCPAGREYNRWFL